MALWLLPEQVMEVTVLITRTLKHSDRLHPPPVESLLHSIPEISLLTIYYCYYYYGTSVSYAA